VGKICLYPVHTGVKTELGITLMFRLVVVKKDHPGFIESKYELFDSLVDAWNKADELNIDMGILTRDQVMEIVDSSMNA